MRDEFRPTVSASEPTEGDDDCCGDDCCGGPCC